MNFKLLVSVASGLLFALGLALSGMTQPNKVLGFLDVSGAWDPTLAFVMLGAIGVHLVPALYARRATSRPVLASDFKLPNKSRVDTRLVVGAVLFGLGWGAAGFCPGPALVSVMSLEPTVLLFVTAMLGGMVIFRFVTPKEH